MTDPLPLQTRSTRSSSRKLEQAKAYAAHQSLPQQRRSVRVVQLQSIKDSKIQVKRSSVRMYHKGAWLTFLLCLSSSTCIYLRRK